ncbi:hypothetical protein HID58_090017, partial [Brassica napus]
AKEPACFSSVIPGWFSEMSPKWPCRFPPSCLIVKGFAIINLSVLIICDIWESVGSGWSHPAYGEGRMRLSGNDHSSSFVFYP